MNGQTVTNSLLKSARNYYFRFFPETFWGPYTRKAKDAGIERLQILLSYDCDTFEDVQASIKLFEKLSAMGIPATFAVPGAQLRESADVYRDLFERGAQFINHGGAPHTFKESGRYRSTSFYSKMSREEVVADIQLGHHIFEEVLGEAPKGFRAPHFGHFQTPEQLELIYKTLRQLGSYTFSSTTTAAVAHRHGPMQRLDDLIEFPIIGTYHWPMRVFDSYTHLQDKVSREAKDSYAEALFESANQLNKHSLPALLNYYADPSHIINSKAYFNALSKLSELGVRFVGFQGP